jgi:hypothetical protein
VSHPHEGTSLDKWWGCRCWVCETIQVLMNEAVPRTVPWSLEDWSVRIHRSAKPAVIKIPKPGHDAEAWVSAVARAIHEALSAPLALGNPTDTCETLALCSAHEAMKDDR